jgi:hypothetical protein
LFMPIGFRKRRNDLLVETTRTRRRPPLAPVRATLTINRLRGYPEIGLGKTPDLLDSSRLSHAQRSAQ